MLKCHVEGCGGELHVQRRDITTFVGNYAVVESAFPTETCNKCGKYTLSSKELGYIELRAAEVVFEQAPQVSGACVQFARVAMGLTMLQLETALGLRSTSSVWSGRYVEDVVPRERQLAILALLRMYETGIRDALTGDRETPALEAGPEPGTWKLYTHD